MAKIKLLKRIIKKDRNGRVNYDSGVVLCRSFILPFMGLTDVMMSEYCYNVTDIDNNSRYIMTPEFVGLNIDQYFFCGQAPDDDDSYGILVGSGSTAVAGANYKMETLIADGMAAGQFEYGGHNRETTAVVGANVDFQFKRGFSNNSGASVAVNELGCYVVTRYDPGSDCVKINESHVAYLCIIREVVSTVNVADMETLEVIFIMRTTV